MSSIKRNRSVKGGPSLLIRRDGNELYIEGRRRRSATTARDVTGGRLVFHDVSDPGAERRRSYHASHDLLTGLVNRREFESRLERP